MGVCVVRARVRIFVPWCVLTINQVGTADTEILSTQRFQAIYNSHKVPGEVKRSRDLEEGSGAGPFKLAQK